MCDREEVQDLSILELKIYIVRIIRKNSKLRMKSCCKRGQMKTRKMSCPGSQAKKVYYGGKMTMSDIAYKTSKIRVEN